MSSESCAFPDTFYASTVKWTMNDHLKTLDVSNDRYGILLKVTQQLYADTSDK